MPLQSKLFNMNYNNVFHLPLIWQHAPNNFLLPQLRNSKQWKLFSNKTFTWPKPQKKLYINCYQNTAMQCCCLLKTLEAQELQSRTKGQSRPEKVILSLILPTSRQEIGIWVIFQIILQDWKTELGIVEADKLSEPADMRSPHWFGHTLTNY